MAGTLDDCDPRDVDGIYLFNFFTPREGGPRAKEPPFAVLSELGDRQKLESLLQSPGK